MPSSPRAARHSTPWPRGGPRSSSTKRAARWSIGPGWPTIVFADRAELAALEALTHPHIVARIEALVAGAPDGVTAVEMPLIDPPLPWHRLVVLAPTPLRHRRAVERGMDPEDVDQAHGRPSPTSTSGGPRPTP